MHTEIIPAINSESFADVARAVERIKGLTRWIHIDVADGTFTPNILWHAPEELKAYLRANGPELPLLEVHLMIKTPEAILRNWIDAGAKRIIVQVETISDFLALKRACDSAKVLLMLSVAPETPASALDPYFGQNLIGFQVLAVPPGRPGQLFIENSYDKIKYIREKCPWCELEVDGGIKLGIARKCREAGANLLVAASAIFGSGDIPKALLELRQDIK